MPSGLQVPNMSTSTFDALIIGTGQAGPPLAARLAGAGLKVAVAISAAHASTTDARRRKRETLPRIPATRADPSTVSELLPTALENLKPLE